MFSLNRHGDEDESPASSSRRSSLGPRISGSTGSYFTHRTKAARFMRSSDSSRVTKCASRVASNFPGSLKSRGFILPGQGFDNSYNSSIRRPTRHTELSSSPRVARKVSYAGAVPNSGSKFRSCGFRHREWLALPETRQHRSNAWRYEVILHSYVFVIIGVARFRDRALGFGACHLLLVRRRA
jgi:hypothetical protein